MRKIDTSVVASGVNYPGLANVGGQSITGGDPTKMQGLDFLQQALLEMVDALVKAMIVDPTKPTWLYQYSFFSGGPWINGYMYYQGEVFYVTNTSLTAASGHPYLNANIVPNPTDASPNPLTVMSDGSTVSIHNQRTITLTWGTTANTGNLPDENGWLNIQSNFQWALPVINVVGSGSPQPAYNTGWSQANRLAFYILGNEVTIQGDADFTSGCPQLMFTLPLEYRPIQNFQLPIFSSVGGITAVLIQTDGTVSYMGSNSSAGWINMIIKYTVL